MSNKSLSILIIDDEKSIRKFIKVSLTAQGYLVYEASTGEEGMSQLLSKKPDIIVLDLGLPDVDGTDFIVQLREWSDIPIIVLSVREREADKIKALDSGADDYLTKPFSIGELMARLRVIERHLMPFDELPLFEVGDLCVDLSRRRVILNNEEISLTPTEYDILKIMIKNKGRVITHDQLLKLVWGMGYSQERNLLRVNMSNLRRKIEPDPQMPRYIFTEPGVGYRLKGE